MTKRGDREAHGYGNQHKKLRDRWKLKLKRAGSLPCARCGLPIFSSWPLNPPDLHVPDCPQRSSCQGQCWSTWDLGHTDDRTAYTGPEHASCNRAAGARNSNRPRARPASTPPAQPKDYGW